MVKSVEIARLCKSFGAGPGRTEVLRNLDFAMEKGSFETVMGASGSGKSTFLHIAAGLLAPSSGSVRIGGTELSGMKDDELALFRRRSIGLVFQDFNLIPTLTAEENVALPMLLDGKRLPACGKAREMLDLLGLSHRRGHFPGMLSGGERQRVAIARALVSSPHVILADEPTGNLDSPSARALCSLLSELNAKTGATILLVSHDPIVAAATDRVHILKDGAFAMSFAPGGDASLVAGEYLKAMG